MRRIIPRSCQEALVYFRRDKTTSFIDPHKINDWETILFDKDGSIIGNDLLMVAPLEAVCRPYLPSSEDEEEIRLLGLSGRF